MKHNPFVPREQRTAILTLDNGQLIPAAYDLIVNIDHTRRLLIMQLPEGLLQI